MGKEPTQIIAVSEKSVAERAGIKVGDVLVALDGTPIKSDNALRRLMADYRWGDEVTLTIRRDGKDVEIEVPIRRVK